MNRASEKIEIRLVSHADTIAFDRNGDLRTRPIGVYRVENGAFVADRVIVVCEEIVDEAVVRRDPNRTVIPGVVVDAVVEQPFACHPSYAQGYYDRDNAFYLEWERISKDPAALERWLKEWVHGLEGHAEYLARMGDRWEGLRAGERLSGQVNYGDYS